MVYVEELTVQLFRLMRATSEIKGRVQELAQLSPGKSVPSEQRVLLDDRGKMQALLPKITGFPHLCSFFPPFFHT